MEAGYGQSQFGVEFEASEHSLGLSTLVEALRMLVRHANDIPSGSQMPPLHPRLRRHARRPSAIRASCRGSWGTSDCLIADISEGGARVVSGHNPRVGEQVTLQWSSSTPERTLQLLCSVRYASATHIGLAFVAISADDMHHITAALRTS